MLAIFADAVRAFRESPWLPPKPGEKDTSIPEGHRFRISMTSAGCYGFRREDGTTEWSDVDYFDEPRTVEVRAWSLRDALTKAAALPLGAWFPEEMGEAMSGMIINATELGGVFGQNVHESKDVMLQVGDRTYPLAEVSVGFHSETGRIVMYLTATEPTEEPT